MAVRSDLHEIGRHHLRALEKGVGPAHRLGRADRLFGRRFGVLGSLASLAGLAFGAGACRSTGASCASANPQNPISASAGKAITRKIDIMAPWPAVPCAPALKQPMWR